MTSILVHFAGPGVSLQDAGRRGYLRFGVTHAGPMDALSHALANIVLGNDRNATAIEVSLGGLEMSTTSAAIDVAVVGTGFNVSCNGKPLPSPCRLTLKTGERLKIAAGESGSWCYVAVAAVFALPQVLGSQSTHSRSGFGGVDGRCLAEGDSIGLTDARSFCVSEGKLIAPWLARATETIRVLPGPQRHYFDAEQYEVFLEGPWAIGARSDRMGVFVEGPRLRHSLGYDIVSDGVVMGSVQVPGDGLPIVLMADSQSTGGYPKIATVIGADLGALSQVRAGGKIAFTSITYDEALQARKLLEANLSNAIEVEPFVRTEFTAAFVAGIDWTDSSNAATAGRSLSENEVRERGELTVAERLSVLFDGGSHSRTDHGNLFVAQGSIYGQNVLAFANSPGNGGGQLGAAEAEVLLSLRKRAQAEELPLVGLHAAAALDSGREDQWLQTFAVLAEQRACADNLEVALVFGQSTGTQAILASLADVVLTAGPEAGLSLASSDLTQRVTNEIVSFAELARTEDAAGARYDNEVSGIMGMRRLLSFFSKPDWTRFADPQQRPAPGLDHIRAGGGYDVLEILKSVADYGDVFELKPSTASGIVTALVKMGGTPCAVIANQPHVNGGLLSVADMEKATDFISFCGRRRLALLRFVDTPGVLHRGPNGKDKAIAAYVRLVRVQSHLKIPRITVVTGEAYGLSGMAMGPWSSGKGGRFRWPASPEEERDRCASAARADDGLFEFLAPAKTRAKVIDALRSMTQAGK